MPGDMAPHCPSKSEGSVNAAPTSRAVALSGKDFSGKQNKLGTCLLSSAGFVCPLLHFL